MSAGSGSGSAAGAGAVGLSVRRAFFFYDWLPGSFPPEVLLCSKRNDNAGAQRWETVATHQPFALMPHARRRYNPVLNRAKLCQRYLL